MKQKVTWLHLSDWHQKDIEYYREKIQKALVEDISNLNRINPALKKIDFIIFTGDIAFSGKKEEYVRAKVDLFEPVMKAAGLEGRFDRLFIVPGNHDLNWDLKKLFDQDLYKEDQAVLEEWFRQERYRDILLAPMAEYDSFTRELFGPAIEPALGYINKIEVDCGKKVGIIGINSAWLSGLHLDALKNVEDKGWLRIVESQFADFLDEMHDVDIGIAAMHHPLDWVNQNVNLFDPDIIENQLLQRCHFLLHGHNHKSRARLNVDHIADTVTISAGSLFAKSDRTEFPPNGFNIVQLNFTNGTGTVFIRRYDDTKGIWDIDTSHTDSKTPGYWKFALPKNLNELSPLDGCSILIVDNDISFLKARSLLLESERNFIVYSANTIPEAMKLLTEHPTIDLALIDIRMEDNGKRTDQSGIDFKNKISHLWGTPVLMMTAYDSYGPAVRQAMRPPFSAFDVIFKKDSEETFLKMVDKALRETP